MNKKRLRWPLQIPSLPQSTRDEYSSQGWRELREDVSCSVSPRPLPHLHHQLSIQATYELLRRLPQATFWAPIPLLLIWFISFSFFSGNNWCVWPWRESNIRTADSCGYPGNINWLKWGTSGNNNPSPYIPIYPYFVQHDVPHPMWVLPGWTWPWHFDAMMFWPNRFDFARWCRSLRSPLSVYWGERKVEGDGVWGIWSSGRLGFHVENMLQLT